MQIVGLTMQQVEMLDYMWNLNSANELKEWQETLDHEDLQTSMLLHELVILAAIDTDTEMLKQFPLAAKVLKKVM
jgi:hypothetical protein